MKRFKSLPESFHYDLTGAVFWSVGEMQGVLDAAPASSEAQARTFPNGFLTLEDTFLNQFDIDRIIADKAPAAKTGFVLTRCTDQAI